ncbi:MAG: HD domain-containing protein [Syntrophobacteraceae bacterium]
MQNISDLLRKQREQLMEDTGEDLLGRHTSLLDIALISIYNRMANSLDHITKSIRSSGALFAIGLYGRRLIGPKQALPIILLKLDSSQWDDNWMSEITAPLTEAGWNVDARQDTVNGVIESARDDFPFFLQLLDLRYISGNRQLADQIDKALEDFIAGGQDEFLSRLYDSVLSRKARLDSSESRIEPDLYLSPGSLAEIGAIRAACRIASNIHNIEDAIFQGYLTRQDVDFLIASEKTLARFLNILHAIPGNPSSVLRFSDQELLASKLGYSARAGFLPVEAFMQELNQLFHRVFYISSEFWERLHESRRDSDEGTQAPSETLEPGLLVRSGKIHIQTGRYQATAENLVRLFSLAAEHGLDFANATRQWVQHNRNVLDSSAAEPLVTRAFLDLIKADAPDLPLLRRFYDLGLMTALIPELAAAHGLVQHDSFHLYPVHEHHLRTLTELKKLLAGDYSFLEPELSQIAQSISEPICIYLAALLHDIGKSSGKEHARRGSQTAAAIAKRLGLSPDESDTVQFLVAQHMLLLDSASLRDLADEEMLTNCALAIKTSEHLDLLALLSFADMAATGPKAQQKWRYTPVIPLYQRLHHLLEKGEPSSDAISERINHLKAQVSRQIMDLMDNVELENYFSKLAPRYLLSMPPEAISRHLRMQWQLHHSDEPFRLESIVRDGSVEITLVSWDVPGLVSKTAGILTLHDMNIVGARVFTMDNDMIIQVFQCRLPEKSMAEPVLDAVQADMIKLHEGKMALDYRIEAHASEHGRGKPLIRPAKSRILIDNDSSGMYTILEVYTVDRVGLLYTICRTLAELQIRISVAMITTKVDQVADVFYIKTHKGQKVTDPEQIEEIKKALKFWFDDLEK